MRAFRFLTIVIILVVAGLIYYFKNSEQFHRSTEFLNNREGNVNSESVSDDVSLPDNVTGQLFSFMNQPSEKVIAAYGNPLRKDKSAYGYTWWIYPNNETEYIQFGIENNVVKTIYATGERILTAPFTIGKPYSEIEELFPFKDRVTYQNGLSFYTFIVKYDEKQSYPLVKLDQNLFIQCYFDTFTNKLSSVRILSGDILTKQRFYEMEYRGNLESELKLSDTDWQEIEKGMERQIFDITNMYRRRHQTAPLIEDRDVREVAYLHSKDMHNSQYFSHNRKDGTGLKERLAEKSILYQAAGENIAAQYSDGPAAVEGWLNSEGHREALLHSGYSHLGVGVYRLYYTQNFIKKR